MNLKFKNRIALFNTVAIAFTTALVFSVIYLVVNTTTYRHLDSDILLEKEEVFGNLDWHRDSIIINKMPEWEEAEHNKIEVNPTFLQIADREGNIIFRTVNLLNDTLPFEHQSKSKSFYNGEISNQRIRIGQFPVLNQAGNIIGQLSIAISLQESFNILHNLIWVMLISFPLVLLIQFITSSYAASRAIKPVHALIHSASGINDSNIHTRLNLPENKDELYMLTQTVNDLLARIEKSMIQQKQFTSDASHEIRTPLSAIRGTLEVLIRKERDPKTYEDKIRVIIEQVDNLNMLLDQLLQLARLDSASTPANKESLKLTGLISSMYKNWEQQASEKKIDLQLIIPKETKVYADKFYLEVILDNLVSNAIKYGKNRGHVLVSWDEEKQTLSIQDDGIGMAKEQLANIFNRFYRIDESRNSAIKGNGLGLSIVKKLSDLQQMELSVKSELGTGSIFTLRFSK